MFDSKATLALERTAQKGARDFIVIFVGIILAKYAAGVELDWELLKVALFTSGYRTGRDVVPALYREVFGEDMPK